MELSKAPRVFISYSWESEDHKQWVRYLGERLYQAGIEARLDQWFIKPGESFTVFMEQEVEQADFVIVVCTPAYAHKSNKRQGGVGYEQQIVSGQLMTGTSRSKFIPILRSGDYEPGLDCAVPTHFRGIAWIEFRNDAAFEESLEDLIRVIFSKPRFAPPPLGARPSLETITDTRLNRNRLTEAHESRELPDSNMEKGDSVKTAVKEADEAAIEVNNAAYSAVESETSGTTKSDRLDNVDGYGNRENAYSEETQLNRLDSSISPKALQSSELGSSSLATATYNLNDKNSDNVKAGLEEAGDTNSDVIETPLTSSQDTSLPNIKVARETKADDLHNTDILPSGKVHNRRQSLIPAAGISLVLLVAIIYAFIKYSSWQNVDIGFNPEGVLTLQLPSPPTKFFTLEDRRAFYTGLIERVASLPGVQSASVTTSLPLTDNDSVVDVAGRTEDTNGGATKVSYLNISPDYFRTLGIPLKQGRYFSMYDDSKSPKMVIINETLARRLFPDKNPIGRQIYFLPSERKKEVWRLIIGIVGDNKNLGPDKSPGPEIYESYLQNTRPSMFLVTRTIPDPMRMVSAIKSLVQEIDKDQPLSDIKAVSI